MSWSRFPLSVCLVLTALACERAFGAGLLVPRDGSPPIQVRSHRVTAEVHDGLARTTLRQTFVNPHGRALEALYVFPLPEGAALTGLALELGDQRLEGFLAERMIARRAYDAIVRQKRDPALVEQIGRSAFRLSVFPVLPDQPTVVELTWIEALPLLNDEYRYVYPLALAAGAASTEQDLTVSVAVRSSVPIKNVSSPTEGMATHLVSEHEAHASLEKSRALLGEDVVVTARVATPEPSLAVHVFRPACGDAFFAALVTPPALAESQVLPRDVTLALDVSGSMEGAKIAQAKRAALWLLEHLRERDRVNVLLFSDVVSRFADAPVPATGENLAALRRFVETAEAGGGTALGDAVQAACSAGGREDGRVGLAVFLTDGLPTAGETQPERIIECARQQAEGAPHAFAFGVGADVDSALLEGIAAAGGGSAEVFRPEGEIESRLCAFLARTSSPAVAGLRVTIDGRVVDDLLPRPLPTIYLGEQAVITGRWRGAGEQRVTVEGILDGRKRALSASVDFGQAEAPAARGEPVARDLYARAKLGWLERALRLRAGLSDEAYFAALERGRYSTEDELVQAEIDLSLETGVHCPYTSFLARLPEDRARLAPGDATALDAALERVTARRRELAGLDPAAADVGVNASPVSRMDPIAEQAVQLDEQVVSEDDTEKDEALPETVRELLARDAPMMDGGEYDVLGVGGCKASQKVVRVLQHVERSLEWLRRHQDPRGFWSSSRFSNCCFTSQCGGEGEVGRDAGMNGLALLAHLGAGNTAKQGTYRDGVRVAARHLLSLQDQANGGFGEGKSRDGFLLDHAIATLAVTECCGLAKWPLLKDPAQKGIDFLLAARVPDGAWRMGDGADRVEDVVLTSWVVLALKSARDFGLSVDPTALD
ncbi:MAG: VWA domain-containing protein [Planctomycetes bacterium]|nr:VWA domain-containing protein [Planctomycetota bacterium]